MLESARIHFLGKSREAREHMQAFLKAGIKRGLEPAAAHTATQDRMKWSGVDAYSFTTLHRFACQEEVLPKDLRQVIRWLNGGKLATQGNLLEWSQTVGFKLRTSVSHDQGSATNGLPHWLCFVLKLDDFSVEHDAPARSLIAPRGHLNITDVVNERLYESGLRVSVSERLQTCFNDRSHTFAAPNVCIQSVVHNAAHYPCG